MIVLGFHPDVTVLCAGDYPSHPTPLGFLTDTEKVICCDSAAEDYVEHMGKAPWRIVGDLDSISTATRETMADHIVHFSEQETNDMSKAVHYAKSNGMSSIAIVGATGKREDHTLGNIALLCDYQSEGLNVRMYTDHGVFVTCHKSCSFSLPVGTKISVFNHSCSHMSSSGLLYPLYTLTRLWQGTLNTVSEQTVTIDADGDYLLYICYE